MSQPQFPSLSVLIVDDSRPMRNVLRALMRSFGIEDVLEAADGAGALDILRSRTRNLVITDLSMQPMDGIEFTRRLRLPGSGNPTIPVLMISGHTEVSHVKQALEAGVTEFLVKPVTTAALCQRLKSIVAHPKPVVSAETYSGPDRRRSSIGETRKRRRKSDIPRDAPITFV